MQILCALHTLHTKSDKQSTEKGAAGNHQEAMNTGATWYLKATVLFTRLDTPKGIYLFA